MCGRYRLKEPEKAIAEFSDESGVGLGPAFNVAPTRVMPVILGGHRQVAMAWGYVPFYERNNPKAFGLINARGESAIEKPAFRQAVQKRRCAIVADGFYEWRKNPDGTKQPFFIGLKGGAPFAFAGIFEPGVGDTPAGFCILTTGPNDLMKPIHERMPVILDRSTVDAWIEPAEMPIGQYEKAVVSYPTERMEAWPVLPIVNNARNDLPICSEPIPDETCFTPGPAPAS